MSQDSGSIQSTFAMETGSQISPRSPLPYEPSSRAWQLISYALPRNAPANSFVVWKTDVPGIAKHQMPTAQIHFTDELQIAAGAGERARSTLQVRRVVGHAIYVGRHFLRQHRCLRKREGVPCVRHPVVLHREQNPRPVVLRLEGDNGCAHSAGQVA